jgi:hypothetical protein
MVWRLSLFGSMTKSVKSEPKKSSEKKVVAGNKATKPEAKKVESLASTSKKIVSTQEVEKLEKAEQHLNKKVEEKKKEKKDKKPFSIKKLIAVLTGVALLLVILGGGAWIWVLGTPEYTYFRVYTAAKDKNFDKFMEYVDATATSEDLVKQESDYLKQNNINEVQAKFSIKGTLEYTFFQYIDTESLTKILPFDASDGWLIFNNKDIIKEKDSFTINLKSEPKLNNTEGIFGYKQIVFKMKGNKWVISQLKDNPGLENAKKEAAAQQAGQNTSTPQK